MLSHFAITPFDNYSLMPSCDLRLQKYAAQQRRLVELLGTVWSSKSFACPSVLHPMVGHRGHPIPAVSKAAWREGGKKPLALWRVGTCEGMCPRGM